MGRVIYSGVDQLITKGRGIRANIERTAIKRNHEALQPAFELALRLVPVDTGWLKSTIRTEATANEAQLIASAPHAGYVEYGTRKMAAQPYLRPAAELMTRTGVTIWAADLRLSIYGVTGK